MELLTHKSDNSPHIVILRDQSALTTSIGWFVRTGSRDESPELAGVSHFLEHMVFKGTERRSAADVNRELDHLGAQSNAFTSEDSTVYYASVLPECQQQCLDLLTDLMQPTRTGRDRHVRRPTTLRSFRNSLGELLRIAPTSFQSFGDSGIGKRLNCRSDA